MRILSHLTAHALVEALRAGDDSQTLTFPEYRAKKRRRQSQ